MKKKSYINPYFFCLFKPVTSQRCFDWIQKSGQLIKLMHCRETPEFLAECVCYIQSQRR